MFPLILSPLVSIATHIVVGVVLDRMAQFRADTDWTKVKITADTKVRDVIPGTMLDDTVVRAVNQAIDKIQSAMGETEEAAIVLGLLAAGDFSGAGAELMRHATAEVTKSAA